jgi:hypothetical protein
MRTPTLRQTLASEQWRHLGAELLHHSLPVIHKGASSSPGQEECILRAAALAAGSDLVGGGAEPDEYVEIHNAGRAAVQLASGTLRDESNRTFTFPVFAMQPGQTCRVYTNEYHPQWCLPLSLSLSADPTCFCRLVCLPIRRESVRPAA